MGTVSSIEQKTQSLVKLMVNNSFSGTYFGKGKGNYTVLFYAYSTYFFWMEDEHHCPTQDWAGQATVEHHPRAGRQARQPNGPGYGEHRFFYLYVKNCERRKLPFDFIVHGTLYNVHGTYSLRNVLGTLYRLWTVYIWMWTHENCSWTPILLQKHGWRGEIVYVLILS